MTNLVKLIIINNIDVTILKDLLIFSEGHKMTTNEKALMLHEQWQGKIETVAKSKVKSREDLALAYTPGVAQPCLEIQHVFLNIKILDLIIYQHLVILACVQRGKVEFQLNPHHGIDRRIMVGKAFEYVPSRIPVIGI